MASSGRLIREIRAASKVRQKSPRPIGKNLEPVSPARLRTLTRRNLNELHAIEETIVRCWREDDRIDDGVVSAVLRSVLLDDPLPRMPHSWLYAELLLCCTEKGFDEETWLECVRLVKQSVQDNSTLQPRDRSYLSMVSAFLA